MTTKQTYLYWSLWNRVCSDLGWYHLPQREKDAKRHALHIDAECPASSKAFTNLHFSRYRARCEAMLKGKNDGGAQAVDHDHNRRQLVWRIKDDAKKAGLDEAYIVHLARDLRVLGNWQDLDLDSLTNLRNTIHNRAGSKIGRDTRSVHHAPTPSRRRRSYTLDATPRQFEPRPTAASVSDNQPF